MFDPPPLIPLQRFALDCIWVDYASARPVDTAFLHRFHHAICVTYEAVTAFEFRVVVEQFVRYLPSLLSPIICGSCCIFGVDWQVEPRR